MYISDSEFQEDELNCCGSEKGMSAKDTQELTSHLGNIASENLGMAMMYTLIEEAKQWMTARYCDGSFT